MRKIALVAIAALGMFCLTMVPAVAILVQLGSASQVPFSSKYPEHARKKIRSALTVENSKFVDGFTTMGQTTLNFNGDTSAINAMLLKLSNCPDAVLSVSFRDIDQECDWRIVYTTSDTGFRAVVNLSSDQIALDDLDIPSSRGPSLSRPIFPHSIDSGG